jgi:Uma2 family endonuclease
MRVVLVDAPESLLDERRRLGMDKFDERWEGEWHFVNPPKSWHALLNGDLLRVLGPHADRAGLRSTGDALGVFAAEKDWRVPDQAYLRPEQIVEEGVTGAELVVEFRSPGDESYEKLPFYAGRGITEAMIVHRDRRFELFRLDGAGAYQPVEDGRSEVLGVTFSTVEGPKLRIDWEGGSAEV